MDMRLLKLFILLFSSLFFGSLSSQIFIADTNVCGNTKAIFRDVHVPPVGKSVAKRFWDFDGVNKDTTTIDSVIFAYSNSIAGATLTVNLTVEYDDATRAILTPRNVRVWALPIIDTFAVDRPITCPAVNILFLARSKSNTDPAASGGTKGDFIIERQVYYGDTSALVDYFAVNTNIRSYSAMGVYTAVYTVKDNKGCMASKNLEVRIIKTPEVKFLPLNPRCKDSLVIYENRTEGRDTTWSWNWTFVDSLYIKGSQGQDSFILPSQKAFVGNGKIFETASHKHPFYANFSQAKVILWGTNKFNCTDSADIFTSNVDTTPTLVFTPRADTTICFGESVQYTIRGSDTIWYGNFQWGNKISGDSIVLFTPRNTITYKVYGKTPQCPPTSKDIKITVVQPLETKVTTEPQYILRGAVSSMKLITNGILDSVQWSPDTNLSRRKFDSTGAAPEFTTTYKVRLFYSLNRYVCSQLDSATIFVNRDCQVDSLKIPTAFSPNGDGLNDEFYVKSFSLKTILSFNVYNRWGNNVFKVGNVPADDKQYYWNGKINNNGDEVPVGVYIYNISAVCKNDEILNFQGEITVLR